MLVRRAFARAGALFAGVLLAGVVPGVATRPAEAQVPLFYRLDAGQSPRGIDWRRIDTPHFTVIYPDSLAREAQRAASLLERAYEPLGRSLIGERERIPVVLNDQSMISNAYVGWGPRRSHWYPLPNTTVDALGPVDWYGLLAVHEGRHIVQERAVRTGLVGVASRLFGDYTTAFLGGALYFPSWLWEGDAVGMETALTADGRGRQPSFTARIRALRLSGAPYDYYQAWNGSYRTYYPDWYELGYVLTTHVRRRYGETAWRDVIRRAARNPIAPLALSRALDRVTGRSLVQVQRDAVAELDSLWKAQVSAVRETPATIVSPRSTDYHVWSTPQYAGDGSVIAAYSDLATTTELVRLRAGRREVLVRRPGLSGELQFHVSGNGVVWSEYERDPRWGERSYLVIRHYDLTTGRVRRLTDRSRYFGPALSPDGTRIAAVHFSVGRESALVVLDAASGKELQRLPNAGGRLLVTPAWSPGASALLAVMVDPSRGNALVRVPLDGSAADTLIPFTHDAISRPVASGGRVYFGSPRSGIDNLYVLDTATRVIRQVTSRKLGAMWAAVSPDGRQLLWSDYSVDGYDVAESAVNTTAWTDVQSATPHRIDYAEPIVRQEGAGSILDSLGAHPWPSAPFGGRSRLFDFHSVTVTPTSDGLNTGLSVESRNVLNTFGTSVGAVFNLNERTAAAEVGASYAGLPVIGDFALRVGSRASSYVDSAGRDVRFSWRERSVNAALRLPLARLAGQTRQSLVATAGIGLTHVSDQPVSFRFENNNGRFTPVTWSVTASHVRSAATRDLLPTGASLTAVYRHTPLGGDYEGHLFAARGALLLPGLAAHHAFVLDAAQEEQRPTNYRFSREYLFPRGYASRFHERFVRAGATYSLPLLYPDLALGPWAYVRRVQGAAFADFGRGETRTNTPVTDYRSVGAELTTDVAPFGLRYAVRTGVRVSQTLTAPRRTVAEFLLTLP